jgi:hypothetical protein
MCARTRTHPTHRGLVPSMIRAFCRVSFAACLPLAASGCDRPPPRAATTRAPIPTSTPTVSALPRGVLADAAVGSVGAKPLPRTATPDLIEGTTITISGGVVHVNGNDLAPHSQPEFATTRAGEIEAVETEDASIPHSEELVLGSQTIYPPTCPPDAAKDCAAVRSLHGAMEGVTLLARLDGPGADDTTVLAKSATMGNACYGGGPIFFMRIAPNGTVAYSGPLDICMGTVEITRKAHVVTVRVLEHYGRGGIGTPGPKFPEMRFDYDVTAGRVLSTTFGR